MKRLFSIFFAAVTLWTIPAQAAPEQFCRDYASGAQRDAQANAQRRCGFSGERWNPRYEVHFNWCRQVPERAALDERYIRREQLSTSCAGVAPQGGSRAYCDGYARQAIADGQAARQRGCANAGAGMFGQSYAPHFNWCTQVGQERAEREAANRRAALAACRPTQDGGYCDTYAREAISDGQAARQRGCANAGAGMFGQNYAPHFNWCNQVGRGRAEREAANRRAALEACTGGTGGGAICTRELRFENGRWVNGCGQPINR